ncbi:MAG TPA: hypothetical protein VHF22_11450, partial [Planctomycetota bacterium]|nr:hypothetical protein [Planctomycetota bacterium]
MIGPRTQAWLARLPLALLPGLAAAVVWVGATPTRSFPWDTPIIFEGGWRVYQGQVPHVDFYCPLGPVLPWIVGLGMRLAGPTVDGIAWGSALATVAVGAWAWLLGSRLKPWQRAVFTIYAASFLFGTHGYGYSFTKLGYGALYNRIGVALLALVLVESWVPARDRRGEVLGGLSSGALVVALTFLKVSYLGLAALVLGAGLALARCSRARAAALGAGAAAAFLLVLAGLRFELGAWLRDMSTVIQARSGSLLAGPELERLLTTIPEFYEAVCALAALWIVLGPGALRPAGFALAAVLAVEVLLYVMNGQPFGQVLLPAGALAGLAIAERQEPARGPARGAAALVALLAGTVVLPNVLSLATSALYRQKVASLPADRRFASRSLERLVVFDDPGL